MILDFPNRVAPDGCLMNWDVVSLPDGNLIDDVFYADDEAGIVMVYVRDDAGNLVVDLTSPHRGVAQEAWHCRIRVIPRRESPRVTGAPWGRSWEPEGASWRDRAPLL